MTEISRIASEIARLIRFRDRIEEAECEAKRQRSHVASDIAQALANRAWDRTVTIPPRVCPMVVLSRAREDAAARKDALEASALAVEPETLDDALVLAVLAYSTFDLFESDESPPEAERRRLAHLMGAVVRGLEKHVDPTPDIETLVSRHTSTMREPWAAIEAEAERVADALLPLEKDKAERLAPVVSADAAIRAEAAE